MIMGCSKYRALEEIATNKENTLIALLGQMRCGFLTGKYDISINYAEKDTEPSYASEDNKLEAQYHIGKSYFSEQKYDQAFAPLQICFEKNKGDWGQMRNT